jgi:hypothetical protein
MLFPNNVAYFGAIANPLLWSCQKILKQDTQLMLRILET